MKYRRRVFFTDKQKSEIWDRWQRGESMNSIGRGFDRSSSSIYPLLARNGGIRPPEPRAVSPRSDPDRPRGDILAIHCEVPEAISINDQPRG